MAGAPSRGGSVVDRPSVVAAENVLLRGNLLKQSPDGHSLTEFQPRFVVVDGPRLCWYKSSVIRGEVMKGCVDFAANRCTVEVLSGEQNTCFLLKPCDGRWTTGNFTGAAEGREFVFDARHSEHNVATWLHAIRRSIAMGIQAMRQQAVHARSSMGQLGGSSMLQPQTFDGAQSNDAHHRLSMPTPAQLAAAPPPVLQGSSAYKAAPVSISKGSGLQRQYTADDLVIQNPSALRTSVVQAVDTGKDAAAHRASSTMKLGSTPEVNRSVFERLFEEACHDDLSLQSISRDELPMAIGLLEAAGSMGSMAAGLLRNADANKDGVLTRAEWDTYTKYLEGTYPSDIIARLEEVVSKADLPSIRQRLQDARSRLPSGWVWCANAQSLGQHTYEHKGNGLKASTLEEAIAAEAQIQDRAAKSVSISSSKVDGAESRAKINPLEIKTVRLPPGFTMVPSKVTPGRYCFHDPSTQMSYESLEEASMAYEKQQASMKEMPADKYMLISKTVSQSRRLSRRASRKSSSGSLDASLRDIVLGDLTPKRSTAPQSTGPLHRSSTKSAESDMSLPQPFTRRLKSAVASVPDPGLDGGFVDAQFPPCDDSFGIAKHNRPFISDAQRDATRWIRLPEIMRLNGDLMPTEEEREAGMEDDFEPDLFVDIEPQCPTQGLVGNCWLIASIAALAEFPDAIRNLFVSQCVSEDGQYMVRLFDMNKGEWEEVVVDDYVPCIYQADYSDIPCTFDEETGKKVFREECLFNEDGSSKVPRKWIPQFAKPAKRQLWAPLLEKAMAKFVGSYGLIAGGNEAYALTALTGFPIVYCFRRPSLPPGPDGVKDTSRAMPGCWEWCGAQFIRRDVTGPNLERLHGVDALGDGTLWDKLSDYDSRNFVMTASITKFLAAADRPAATSINRPDGLVNGHAYSLISCRSTQEMLDGEEIKLVLLRNPHGEGQAREDGVHNTEWTGDWCDASPLWERFPEVARQVGFEPMNDGLFWMSWSHFARIFDKVFVLPRTQQQPRGQLTFARRQDHRAEVCLALHSLAKDEPDVEKDLLGLTYAFDPFAELPDFINDGTRDTRLRWEATKPGRLQAWLDLNKNAGNMAGYNYIVSKVKALGLERALGPSGHIT